jgi:hypothetical protein
MSSLGPDKKQSSGKLILLLFFPSLLSIFLRLLFIMNERKVIESISKEFSYSHFRYLILFKTIIVHVDRLFPIATTYHNSHFSNDQFEFLLRK